MLKRRGLVGVVGVVGVVCEWKEYGWFLEPGGQGEWAVVADEARGGEPARGGATALMCGFSCQVGL